MSVYGTIKMMKNNCLNCNKQTVAKGYCHNHYMQNVHNKNRPLYSIWSDMKQRCFNQNHAAYKYYGARSISVCERWLTFENFVEDMGERPTGTSLDRINNDGNYEPGNCRWATPKEQMSNRRVESKARASSKSGILGVRKIGKKWQARGRHGVNIGYYQTKAEAIEARKLWKVEEDGN